MNHPPNTPPANPGKLRLPWQRVSLVSAVSAAPDLALGVTFLAVWVAPARLGPLAVKNVLLLMLLELIIIHSAAFMGVVACSPTPRSGKAGILVALGVFYSLFVGAFSLAFKTWWPFMSFWALTANRLLHAMISGASGEEELSSLRQGWAVTVMAYILFCFITVFLPIPRLGMSREIVAALELPGSGLWIDEPHRAAAFGFLYFTAIGLWEFFDGKLPQETRTPLTS